LAQAIKAIIYKEIKEKYKEMSGLDRAAEMMRIITKAKVDEILKNKDDIQKIIDYLEQKQKNRQSSDKKDEKKDEKKDVKKDEKKDEKKDVKKIKRPQPDFESSISETSNYDSSDSPHLSKKPKSKKKGKRN